MARKNAVDVALLPGHQLLDLGGVPVGGGLHQLLGEVPGHVGLEELLEQGR